MGGYSQAGEGPGALQEQPHFMQGTSTLLPSVGSSTPTSDLRRDR